jgi:hypothetical protein
MILIVGVRFEGGSGHEHIVAVRWREREEESTYVSSSGELVELLSKQGGEASTRDGAKVYVVPHLRLRRLAEPPASPASVLARQRLPPRATARLPSPAVKTLA